MKILMTADTVGGVWTYALELVRALEPHGVEIALATMGAPLNASQWEEAEALCNLNVIESGFALEWMPAPWEDVRQAGEWLLSLESRFQPDIVHLNGYAHGALPWGAPTLMVGHSCVLSWWRAVKGEAAPPEWEHYRQEVRSGLQAASLVVAPSHAMLDALQEHYGPFASPWVIPNGRRPELFCPGLKQERVLSAGRLWDEAKNVAALEEAALPLPWPVYVAGEQQHPGGGSRQTSHVRLLGRLPSQELAEWLACTAIYALPARYEPFGLSALEAGMAGCALVLGDIPSLREIWGDAALFVPPDDIDALQATLALLMADGGYRQEMARRARRQALLYTPQRMAADYLTAYRMLQGVCPCVS